MKYGVDSEVSIKDRLDLGKVTIVELDGDTVYVVLKNGVEMDFHASKIQDASALKVEVVIDPITNEWLAQNIDARVIGHVRFIQAKACQAFPGSTPWDRLPNLQRLNLVAAARGGLKNGMELYEKIKSGEINKEEFTAHVLYNMAQANKAA